MGFVQGVKIYYEAFKRFQLIWKSKENKWRAIKAILAGIIDSYKKKIGQTFQN